jgi:hypothetical protein
MPAILFALGTLLINISTTLVGRVLLALGMGVATFTGMQATMGYIGMQFVEKVRLLPPEVIGMLGVMKLGVCVSVITSAIAVKLLMNGLTGDTFKRWVMR